MSAYVRCHSDISTPFESSRACLPSITLRLDSCRTSIASFLWHPQQCVGSDGLRSHVLSAVARLLTSDGLERVVIKDEGAQRRQPRHIQAASERAAAQV